MRLGIAPQVVRRNLILRNAFLERQLLQQNEEEEEPKPFNHFKPHKLFEEREVNDWTESDVLQWWDHPIKGPQIPELHKEKYRPLLKANRVNGAALLMLDPEGWQLLGISEEGHISRITAAIAACQEAEGKEMEQDKEKEKEKEKEKDDTEKGADGEEGALVHKSQKRKLDTDVAEPLQHQKQEGKGKEKVRDEDSEEPEGEGKEKEAPREQKKPRLEKEDLVQGECPICIDTFEPDEMANLSCGHTYCRGCIHTYLEMRITSKEFPIPCPNPQCGKEVNEQDVKKMMPEELVNKYESFSLASVVERNRDLYSCCPTIGCDYVFIWMKGDDPHFRCPKCRKHYCLNCQTDYHKGKSCIEFREWVYKNSLWYLMNRRSDELFQEHALGKKYKKCPNCNAWTVKIDGCNSMTCSCGNHFCYACGKADCDGYSCPAQAEPDAADDSGQEDGDNEDY